MNNINELFNIFKDPKKIDVVNKLKTLGITTDFNVNDDYSVTLLKDVVIMNKKMKESPVNFSSANGNFIWHYSDLETMKNLPNIVMGNMSVAFNNIKSMKDSKTNSVSGSFNCSGNKLDDLKGSPNSVGSFIAMNCKLKSLDGAPIEIGCDFLVSQNNLTTLEGGPIKVGGLYDCSNNKLENVIGSNIYKKMKCDGNNIKTTGHFDMNAFKVDNPVVSEQDTIFKENDYVIYHKEDSKFNNMIGMIFSVIEPTKNSPEKTYYVTFNNEDNEELNKDAGINGVKGKYLTKVDDNFNIGDIVKYQNPNSKYNGFTGVVLSTGAEEILYRVEFNFENPGLKDLVNVNNSNKLSVILAKIKPSELKLIKKSDKTKEPIKEPIKEPVIVKSTTPIRTGDDIVYIDPFGGELDGCKGKVTFVSYIFYNYDIRLISKFGREVILKGVSSKNLEKIEKPKIKTKFSKGDKIIYVAKDKDFKNKEFHQCKGEVTYANEHAKPVNYDVKIYKQNNVYIERLLYFIDDQNLIPDTGIFSVGDKVLYTNIHDELNGKYGIVKKSLKSKYDVLFNDNGSQITVTDIGPEYLTKSIKPIGTEAHIDDNVVYTKFDSKHYGCNGVVTGYNINTEKPFEVELISKENKIVKIKTTDDNLELLPPDKTFKKGDKIRYINSNSNFDGLIGTVDKVIQDGKRKSYELILKNDKNALIYLTTSTEYLILLEEAADAEDFIYGQIVKYFNPDSKYEWGKVGREGEFQGERLKDGKKEYIVKFDDANSFLKLYVDPDMLTAVPGGKPIPTTTTYTTTYAPVTTVAKKKKKKEVEPEKPPILVYNRRNVARKAYKKTEESDNLKDSEDIL